MVPAPPRALFALSLSVVAACGARSGLSDETDAGASAPRDAARPDAARRDARVEPALDAGALTCPAPPALGFRFVPRPMDLPTAPRTLSLTTLDGAVYLAALEDVGGEPHVVVRRIDALGGDEPALVADLGEGEGPVVGSGDGMLAVAYETPRAFIRLVVLRPDGALEWSVEDVPTEGIDRIGRPVHNGASWLVGFTSPYAHLSMVDRDGFSGIVMFGPVDERYGIAVDPDTGTAHVLYRALVDDSLLLVSVDRDGRILEPTRGRPIGGFPWEGVPSLGWTSSLGAWPLVLGGFSLDAEGSRMRVHRYEVDSLPGPGFSSPAAPSEHRWALTTLPPPRHATGYGFVGAELGPESWQLRFHGSGEDFVGDSQPIGAGASSETFDVDITPDECGYLVAWIDGTTTLQTVTAIPR